MRSSQTENTASVRAVRWRPLTRALVLAGGAGAVSAGTVFGARRARARPPAVLVNASTLAARDPMSDARERLEQFEEQRRRSTDFEHLQPANGTHGADPYALARLDAEHFIGVLRGASALVVLDRELRELDRIQVPDSVVSLAVTGPAEFWSAGETSPWLTRYRFDGRRLLREETRKIPGILGVRALTAGTGGTLYALDVQGGRLLTLRLASQRRFDVESRVVGHGPLSIARLGDSLIVDLLLDHALVVYRLNERGGVLAERARLRHDGPIWGFSAAQSAKGELLLAATGVEDHPLDRSDGSFGYIDSFVFQYLLPVRGEPRLCFSVNVSELGVVTPKAPLLRVKGAEARLFVSGYGSDRAVDFVFEVGSSDAPRARSERFVPGSSASLELDATTFGFADPLLDAWLVRHERSTLPAELEIRPVVAESAPRAPADERLGEALFFTTLMAPHNSSAGKHSRFSCETCHFEGYVDGRVHSTGRADQRVATKPLRGLSNNRPHFSRALDPGLASVAEHEFRVAGQGSGSDPWFSVRSADFPWLAELGVPSDEIDPEALRRALVAFLMGFSHDVNPAIVGRHGFDEREQRGAEIFRARCARCHAARLQANAPESELPFERWERAIFSPDEPLVWASADYQKTGVTPYVHELGARVPSLRRLYAKWPHFTDGSANTVSDVLRAARFDERGFYHAHAPEEASLEALSSTQVDELGRFLDLL